ncbi:hypothetical protein [Deinococcus arenicola]|uniref:Sensor histidine kinase n=1 Tax=Deinococcus arenicola TaxID=2994950 RepID=A0ABU4DQV9_9DEIO|nr:hypothetical protein [Deinococcus sp. ZS9-10]MDV6374815.1 hypothetical protein [Deinococcus sp. ZS9-10]
MVIADILLNFSILVACFYGISLTYQNWPIPAWPREYALRMALCSLTALLVVLPLNTGGAALELWAVPITLLTMRRGMGWPWAW